LVGWLVGWLAGWLADGSFVSEEALAIRDLQYILQMKVKMLKFTPEQATKAQRGIRGTALLLL
jgi:hypothetical protein